MKNLTPMKYVAIALMALAFLMLNLTWIKLEGEALDEMEELAEDFERGMDFLDDVYDDDVEEALEDQGYSGKELKKMTKAVKGSQKMIKTLAKGRYSVWSAVSLMSNTGDVKTVLAEDSSKDSDLEAAFSTIQTALLVFVAGFAVTGVFMILTIVARVTGKKGSGAIAAVLSVLLALIVGVFALAIGGATIAVILAPVLTIASNIVWKKSNKIVSE